MVGGTRRAWWNGVSDSSGIGPIGCEFPEEEVKDVIAKLGSVIQYLHSRFICVRSLLGLRRTQAV